MKNVFHLLGDRCFFRNSFSSASIRVHLRFSLLRPATSGEKCPNSIQKWVKLQINASSSPSRPKAALAAP
jgi:hypothetical protein